MISLLHLDSDGELLKAVQQYLKQHGGMTTTTVTSAKQALDLLAGQEFDVIISSYDLPDLNGTEFLRSLRDRNDTTPFIFFSETGKGNVTIDALNLGADFFLQKGRVPQKEFGRLKTLVELAAKKKNGKNTCSSEDRTLDTLFNTSPDEIAITDLAGTLTRVSEKGLALFGLKSPDEALGTSIFNWILPEYHEEARRNVQSVFNGTHTVPHEYQLRRTNGTTFWGEINAAPLCDADGRPTGMISIVRDISERKKTEEALNESEMRYRNLVESLSDLVWEVDGTGTFTYVSPNARNILGYEPGEIIGKTLFSLMPKGESERVAGIFLDYARGKKPIGKLESRNLRKDGRIVILETSGVPVFDSKGNLTGYRGVDRDITERKWIEILLTESEEKFRTLADTTSAAIMIYQNTRWVYANHAAEIISGYSKDEILSMNFWDIVHPDYREQVKNLGWARMREEVTAPRQLELRIIRKDGEVRWIDLTAGTITYRQKTAGVLTVIDITGRKNAETELKKSEEKYRAIFNSFDDLYYQADMKGIITNISPSCKKLTGFSPVDLIGRPVLDLYIFPEQRTEILAELNRSGSVHDYEVILKNKAGEQVNVSVNSHLVRDSLGRPVGVEGTLRNISDRKRMEEELRKSEGKYRSLVDNLNVGIFRNTAEVPGKWLWANPEFLEMYGYDSLEELMSRTVSEIYVHPEDRTDLLYELKMSGFVRNYQVHIKKKDGTPIWVSLTSQAMKDERGKILWIDGITRDITRQKQMEEALQQSEESYRGLFDTVKEAICIHAADGTFLDVNEGAVEMYGYPRDYFTGKTPEFLSAPGCNDPAVTARRIREAFGGEPQLFEFWGVRKDGEVFPEEVRLYRGTYFGKDVVIAIAHDITGRRKAESALRESEELFRTLFNNANDAIFLHEIQPDGVPGRYLKVNDIACKRLGYTREELLIMSPAEVSSEKHRPKIPEIIRMVKQDGHATFDAIHRRKDGTEFPVEVSTHTFELHGKVLALSVARDITERKRMEEDLKGSEDYLKTIFNSVQTGLLIIDPENHTIVDANPAAERMIGVDKSRILGKTCHRFVCPTEKGNCPITDKGRAMDNDERVLLRANGEKIPVLKMVVPILLNGKQHLLESFSDISKRVEAEKALQKLNEELEDHVRKRTEALVSLNEQLQEEITKRQQVMAALQKSEEMYRGLVEHMLDVVFRIDMDGTIRYCSPSILDLLGYAPEELIGKSSLKVIAAEDHPHLIKTLELHRPVTGFVLTMITKTGDTRTVEVNADHFLSPDGTPEGYHGILRDITEQKKMQEAIAASLQEKEIMLKEIHHRVKNNMQVISSLLSIQAKQVKDQKTQEIIREGMNRVRSIALVHEKLYLSRNLSSIDFAEYINKMTGYLFQTYNVNPHVIRVTVDVENIFFSIDRAIPISLILNELLSNALKYAFPDGKAGEIRIGIHREGDNYIFMVADNGVGLPEGIDLVKSETLGLQLVDTLVKQIQGTLEVERTGGTVFRIRFPAP